MAPRSVGRGPLFILVVAVLIYGLVSVGVAIIDVSKCGNEDSPKHWVYFPPGWECDVPTFVSPN